MHYFPSVKCYAFPHIRAAFVKIEISMPFKKVKVKVTFYLTSVVPSVLQTRDCYQWKPTVRPLSHSRLALQNLKAYFMSNLPRFLAHFNQNYFIKKNQKRVVLEGVINSTKNYFTSMLLHLCDFRPILLPLFFFAFFSQKFCLF